MKKIFNKKRLLSLFLSGVLIAGVIPTPTFAHQYEGVFPEGFFDQNGNIRTRQERNYKSRGAEEFELEFSEPIMLNSVQASRPTLEELLQEADIDAKIAEIEAEIQKREADKPLAEQRVKQGIKAFLEWAKEEYPDYKEDIESAQNFLNKYIEKGDINLDDPNDASSYKNVMRSIKYLERQNELRLQDPNGFNCKKQNTNFEILMKAIISANRSTDPKLGHRRTFRVGENLAWGYDPDDESPDWNDPFRGWYFKEKLMWEFQRDFIEQYLKDHPGATKKEATDEAEKARLALDGKEYKGQIIDNTQIGHYICMLYDYDIAAVAVNTNKKVNNYGCTWAMNADYAYSRPQISQEDFRAIIEKYEKITNVEEIEKEIQGLKEDLALAKQAKVEKEAQAKADEALTALEGKKGDVTDQQIADAKALIDKVTIQAKKDELNGRLDAVKAAKAELDAQKAADEALKVLEGKNGNVTDQQITDAKALIDKVKNTEKKSEFNGRLEKVKKAKAELDAQKAADEALTTLEGKEGNVTNQEITDAEALVNKVTDTDKKQEFERRLQAVKDAKAEKERLEREALEAATQLVEKAETEKTQETYNKAKEKVKALNPSEGKTKLEARLVDVDKYIQADNAIKALEAKKGNVTEEEIKAAQNKVNEVSNETNKQALNDKLDKVRAAKADKEAQDAADKAIKALEGKNGNVTDTEIQDAQTLVDKVQDQTAKDNLNKRLNDVRDAKTKKEAAEKAAIDEAKDLVVKAENQQTEEAYTAAKEKVEALNPSGAKTELQARLAELDKYIQADNAIKPLEAKKGNVTDDEIQAAQDKVNEVTNVANKQALNDKLDKVRAAKADKEAQDAADKAIKALEAKEGNVTDTEITDAETLVNKVQDQTAKQSLTTRLDNVRQSKIDREAAEAAAIAEAKDLVVKAENQQTEEAYTAAKEKVEALNPSGAKTDLEARLVDVDNLIKADKALAILEGKKISDVTAKELTDAETLVNTVIKDEWKTELTKRLTELKNKKADDDRRKELENYKTDAKAKVDALDKLNQEEKDAYKARISDAENKEDVDSIVLEAQKDNAKKIIESLDKLTEEERTNADNGIDGAADEARVKAIVDEAQAKQNDRQALEDYKKQEKAKVDALDKLTEEEKTESKNKIDEAETKEAVAPIVLGAQKDNAKKKVEELTKLNEEEKAEALRAIDEATNEESLDKAIKTAEASNVSIDELKAQAKDKLNNLDKLTEEEKADILKKIDGATSKANVIDIITEAEKENNNKAPEETGRDQYPWGPTYNYNPFWSLQFYSPTITSSKPANETKAPVEIKMDSKLVIGSKTLVVTVDGVQKEVVMDVEPFISNNRTMLPIRFVAEALGFNVKWDETNRTVILTDKDTVVKIPVDTNKIIVNGVEYESDTDPILKSNRTMLPIANIARALGLVDGKDIIWNGTTKEVTIKRETSK